MKKPEIKKDRKLSNLEVLQLHSALKNLKNVPGVKLNYAIARTIQHLKPIVEAYNQDLLIPKSVAFADYEEALRKAYADISSNGTGKPKTRIMQTQAGEYETFDIDINGVEAREVRAKLQDEFREAIEARKADIRQYNNWLLSECEDEYNIHKVALSDMPQNDNADYKDLWDACIILLEESPS